MSRYSGRDLAMPTSWANYGRGARARVQAALAEARTTQPTGGTA